MAVEATSVYEQVQQAIRNFSHTSRFSLLRDIPLGRFLVDDGGRNTQLCEMTFARLLESAVQPEGILTRCTPSQAEELLQVLYALGEEVTRPGQYNEQLAEPCYEQQPSAVDDSESNGGVISSVQLETELRSAMNQITAHQRFSEVATRTLSEFWDKSWTPAPFEEALTIRQLASIDVAVLFKKKMVSETRMVNVCEALGRVLRLLAGSEAPVASAWQPTKVVTDHYPLNAALTSFLEEDLSCVGLSVYETLVRGQREQVYPDLVPFLDAVLDGCTPQECIQAITADQIQAPLTEKLASIAATTLALDVRTITHALLQGPALRIDYLAKAMSRAVTQPTALSRALATLVARAHGAVRACHENSVFEGFWTLHPLLLAELLAKRSQQGRGKVATSKLSEPQASPTLTLDPFLQKLLQAQGGTVVKRKGRRNGLKSRSKRGK
jgi:hypothetical protein